MEQFAERWKQVQETFPDLISLGMNMMGALLILIAGWIIARWIQRRLRRSKFGTGHIDPTLRPVIASVAFYVIVAMTIYAFLSRIGVPAQSLLAIFGAAGLAIGLALKDTLGNIAAGVMLLFLRPLKIGEFIDTPNFAGTVDEIGLFATSIKNTEGVYVYVPNGQVWNARMTNFGRHTQRKLIVDIGVAYDTDLEKVRELLLGVMEANPLLIKDPTPPECYVMNFGDSAITISSRCWLPAPDWFKTASEQRIALKKALDDAGIEIPFPQRVIHQAKSKA